MSAAGTTNHQRFPYAETAPYAPRTGKRWLHARARSIVSQLTATLAQQRRERRARAAFRDAYSALRRLDERMLLDIGIRPEQLTAFARASTTGQGRAAAASCREG